LSGIHHFAETTGPRSATERRAELFLGLGKLSYAKEKA